MVQYKSITESGWKNWVETYRRLVSREIKTREIQKLRDRRVDARKQAPPWPFDRWVILID